MRVIESRADVSMLSSHSRCTLMSYNDQSVQHKQPTPGYFGQFRNPGQNVSPGSGMSGHLSLYGQHSDLGVSKLGPGGPLSCRI